MYQTNDRLIDYKGTQKYLITQIKKKNNPIKKSSPIPHGTRRGAAGC